MYYCQQGKKPKMQTTNCGDQHETSREIEIPAKCSNKTTESKKRIGLTKSALWKRSKVLRKRSYIFRKNLVMLYNITPSILPLILDKFSTDEVKTGCKILWK